MSLKFKTASKFVKSIEYPRQMRYTELSNNKYEVERFHLNSLSTNLMYSHKQCACQCLSIPKPPSALKIAASKSHFISAPYYKDENFLTKELL